MQRSLAKTEISGCLIILRGDENFKVLMLKRSSKLAFGSMFSFPGGKVDQSDFVLATSLQDQSINDHAQYFNGELQPWYPAALVASLRETFEEVGLLLHSKSVSSSNFNTFEQTLQCFGDVLPLLRLITPGYIKRRFDTQFFVTSVENSTSVFKNKHHQNSQFNYDELRLTNESELFVWETPETMLNLAVRGLIKLSPPTYHILTTLRGFKSSISLQQFLLDREGHDFTKISRTYPTIFQGNFMSETHSTYTAYPDKDYDAFKAAEEENLEYLRKELLFYAQRKPKNLLLRWNARWEKAKYTFLQCESSEELRKTPLGMQKGTLIDQTSKL